MVLVFLVAVLILIKTEITTVTVKGNLKYYTEEQAEELVFGKYWDRNTLLCFIKSLGKTKKSFPFISDYKINITGPASCELIIYEKKPVGCIKYMSSYMYFDKDGIMIESYADRLDKVPEISGVSFGFIVLGQKLPVESNAIFTDIMNVTQQMNEKNLDCESIKFDEFDNITLILDGGDIDVYIGQNDYLEVKINALYDMLPKIEEKGLKGTLDLSNYTDRDKDVSTIFKVRE